LAVRAVRLWHEKSRYVLNMRSFWL
jgi:hypothetical protein